MRILISLICLACLLIAPGLSIGQTQSPAQMTMAQAGSMPSWTIPVLRLVSATHVEPTTGVIIADSGLVVVPLDFASIGDEIILLDGGTDIIRHGRPAKIVQRFPEQGLQVLSAGTLKRRGAAFSSSQLTDGSQIRLLAFPPAEMIAEGKPPLNIETSVTILQPEGKPVISAQTPLPNVSGALVDECGNLAGYSASNGVQSMSTTEGPGYQWQQDLKRIMAEMQLEPRIADCKRPTDPPPVEEPPVPEAEPEPEPADEPAEADPIPEEAEKPPVTEPEEDLAAEVIEEEEPALDEVSPEELELLPPLEQTTGFKEPAADSSATKNSGVPSWIWLLAAILLFVGAFIIHRVRSGKAVDSDPEPEQTTNPGVDADNDDLDEPEPTSDGMDNILTISGQMADGTAFSSDCKTSGSAINLVIGRGHEDININSATVSRRHASLNGTRDMLTITDLGSSNGTSINGVPCLEGETMYIHPEDIIILGNCRFSFQITTQKQATE